MLTVARWMLVLALMVSIGLHTVVIQSTAWAGMLLTYTLQKGSVSQAVADTFDGRHPCPLCKLAKKAEEIPASDKQAPKADGKIKLHLIAEAVPALVISTPPSLLFHDRAEVRCRVLPHAPETPPPRHSQA